MILRSWKGTVRRADADVYADYVRATGFDEYAKTPGNCGAWLLRRDEGERTEITTLSLWRDRESIEAFAGEDIEAAVPCPEDRRYLIEQEALRITTSSTRSSHRPTDRCSHLVRRSGPGSRLCIGSAARVLV